MSVTPSSAIVGVFSDRANAEQALDALYNMGITHEQVRYSSSENSGGFLDDLKSLFTGQSATGSVASDLSDLGLSNEEADYYANEHRNGNIILAVKAPGREAEVQNILHQYGSLNTQPGTDSPQNTTYATNESVVTNGNAPTPITQPIVQDTETNTPYQSHTPPTSPEHELDNSEKQPTETNPNNEARYTEQPSPTNNNNTVQNDIQTFTEQDTQPITHDNVTETSDTQQTYDSQEVPPTVIEASLPQDALTTTSINDESPISTNTEQQFQPAQDIQPAANEYAMTDPHATSDTMIESETMPDTTTEPQTTHDSYTAESEAAHLPDIQTAQPVATTTDYTSEPNEVQHPDTEMTAENVPTEPLTNPAPTDTSLTNPAPTDEPLTPITTAQQPASETTDELQSLQAQITSLQQQLQAAKAELQSAKEREEQTRAAREREQQLQSLRQQLQALQAELEATHSELQDTHSRLGQY